MNAYNNIFNIKNAYIAVFDILGYCELVKKNTHEELVKLYKHILPSSFTNDQSLKRSIVIDNNPTTIGDDSTTEVRTLMVSDTIILWTKDTTLKCFYDIIYTSMSIIVDSILHGLPVKGAISNGPLSFFDFNHDNIEKSSLILCGAPLISAFEEQNKADWIGCHITKACMHTFLDSLNHSGLSIEYFENMTKNNCIVKHNVPFKEGSITSLFTVNWLLHSKWVDYFNNSKMPYSIQDKIRLTFSSYNKKHNTWQIQRKINNTLDFVELYSKNDVKNRNCQKDLTLNEDDYINVDIKYFIKSIAFGDITKSHENCSTTSTFILCSNFIELLASFRFGNNAGNMTIELIRKQFTDFISLYFNSNVSNGIVYDPQALFTDLKLKLSCYSTANNKYLFIDNNSYYHLKECKNQIYINLTNFIDEIRTAMEKYLYDLDSYSTYLQVATERYHYLNNSIITNSSNKDIYVLDDFENMRLSE